MTTPTETPTDVASHYERLGEWSGVQALISDFIGRVYADPIIGFFFLQVDKARLIERETAFAVTHLGGPRKYEGRPLPKAHKPHPINSGHFHRRLWVLTQTLEAHDVPADIIEAWIAHNRQLEPAITDGTDCFPEDTEDTTPL